MRDVNIYVSDLDAMSCTEWILSPEELARASRFRIERDRRRFMNCRVKLRRVLARYLEVEPARLEFRYNQHGKPYVSRPCAGPDTGGHAGSSGNLYFNVSHAGSLAIFAVSRSREVGIDIERVDPSFVQEQIPERFFSPREVEMLRSLPESSQLEAFFNCWTRKEAYVKARGQGLSLPLQSFDVSLAPGEPAAFLRGAGAWSLEAVPSEPGYVAALVAQD